MLKYLATELNGKNIINFPLQFILDLQESGSYCRLEELCKLRILSFRNVPSSCVEVKYHVYGYTFRLVREGNAHACITTCVYDLNCNKSITHVSDGERVCHVIEHHGVLLDPIASLQHSLDVLGLDLSQVCIGGSGIMYERVDIDSFVYSNSLNVTDGYSSFLLGSRYRMHDIVYACLYCKVDEVSPLYKSLFTSAHTLFYDDLLDRVMRKINRCCSCETLFISSFCQGWSSESVMSLLCSSLHEDFIKSSLSKRRVLVVCLEGAHFNGCVIEKSQIVLLDSIQFSVSIKEKKFSHAVKFAKFLSSAVHDFCSNQCNRPLTLQQYSVLSTLMYLDIAESSSSSSIYRVPAEQKDTVSCGYFTCYNLFAYVNVLPQLGVFYEKVSRYVTYRNHFVSAMKTLFSMVFTDGRMPTLIKKVDVPKILCRVQTLT